MITITKGITEDLTPLIDIAYEFLRESSDIYGQILSKKGYVHIDFNELMRYNIDLAQSVLDNYAKGQQIFKSALVRFEESNNDQIIWNNIPQLTLTPLNEISDQVGKFLTFEGYVMKPTDIMLKAKSIKFECPSCGNIINIVQDNDGSIKEPNKCGCGRVGKFKELERIMDRLQYIEILESLDNVPDKPRRLIKKRVMLENNLTNAKINKELQIGQLVRVHGMLAMEEVPNRNRRKNNEFRTSIVANNIIPLEKSWESIKLTAEEIAKFKQMNIEHDLLTEFAESISPTFEGYMPLRRSLILQLIGGKRIFDKNGNLDERSTIHILLAGNPGCLPKGTKVHTPMGLKEIEFVDEVLTINNDGKLSTQIAIPQFSGKKSIWEIQLGKETIECSGDHRWFVYDGEKTRVIATKDLNTSMCLLCSYDNTNMRSMQQRIQSISFSKEEVLLEDLRIKDNKCKADWKIKPSVLKSRPRTNQEDVSGRESFRIGNKSQIEHGSSCNNKQIKRDGCSIKNIQSISQIRNTAEHTQVYRSKFWNKKSILQAWKAYWSKEKLSYLSRNGTDQFGMEMPDLRSESYKLGSVCSPQRWKQSEQPSIKSDGTVQIMPFQITHVAKTKKQVEMYDLIVPNTHNFILANGIISHNSGKSFIMKRAICISPVWQWAQGAGLTKAGLVASIVKDDFGGFALEVGPLVLADKAILGLDELDKMNKEDYGMLNNAMNDEQTKITKANIDQMLKTRTSLLATSNPIHKKFVENEPILKQLAPIPKDILDRFDLIWVMNDKINKDVLEDKYMARHLQSQQVNPKWTNEEMRRYIAYARQLNPIMTIEVAQHFKAKFLKLTGKQMASGEDEPSNRLRGNILRIAYAHAKFIGVGKESATKDVNITTESIDVAFNILRNSFELLGLLNQEGLVKYEDLEMLPTKKEINKYYAIRETIAELVKQKKGPVELEELNTTLKTKYDLLTPEDIEKEMEKLIKNGEIYEPRRGFISILL